MAPVQGPTIGVGYVRFRAILGVYSGVCLEHLKRIMELRGESCGDPALSHNIPPGCLLQPPLEWAVQAALESARPPIHGRTLKQGESACMTTLMIVESPSKAKKIGQMLGREYRVVASVGHVRDLPPKSMGVAPPDFRPEYEPTDSGKKALAKLRKEMKGCDRILLATDPDREGESIAWHLKEALRLSDSRIARVTYNSVTESAVKEAIKNAGKINMRLVAAQEARRVLDRLVGYTLSFPLSDAIGDRASAGRVQTPTLIILAERDRAIKNFKPTKHFTATLTTEPGFDAEWITKPFVTEDAPYVLDRSIAEKAASAKAIVVDSYEQKKVARKPPAPFTTSVMQQAASAKLSMSAKDSMAAAQKLFENGLITYHRTDSTYLEPDSIKAIREVLKAKGLPIPDKPPVHKSKAGAQEAHEAIRPTDPTLANPTGSLVSNKRRLYHLIHKHTLASQMANKIERVTTIKVHVFRASNFPGW